jgi:hypothetical protein
LSRGEAVIYTPLAGNPTRAEILPVRLADSDPERIKQTGARHPCEVRVHPEESLPELAPTSSTSTSNKPANEIDPNTI